MISFFTFINHTYFNKANLHQGIQPLGHPPDLPRRWIILATRSTRIFVAPGAAAATAAASASEAASGGGPAAPVPSSSPGGAMEGSTRKN